jgi:recombinational DNA repair protein RecR
MGIRDVHHVVNTCPRCGFHRQTRTTECKICSWNKEDREEYNSLKSTEERAAFRKRKMHGL